MGRRNSHQPTRYCQKVLLCSSRYRDPRSSPVTRRPSLRFLRPTLRSRTLLRPSPKQPNGVRLAVSPSFLVRTSCWRTCRLPRSRSTSCQRRPSHSPRLSPAVMAMTYNASKRFPRAASSRMRAWSGVSGRISFGLATVWRTVRDLALKDHVAAPKPPRMEPP